MTARPGQSGSVAPAQLSFLAIYNPSLGNTDDTLHDQIVFYWSRKNGANKRQGNNADESVENTEDRNERLRRIGLAQGMVEFAR
jgi:First Longin domain of INTU, CCZ1 and HPS4